MALRRALPASEVDAKAVKNFWRALSVDVRVEVLSFDDPTLLQRLHRHMHSLVRADLWSHMNGLSSGSASSSDDASGPIGRLKGFELELPAERDCLGNLRDPIAFTATDELVTNKRLFEDLEQQLGSCILDGRPVLQRQDWPIVFDSVPSSWEEFQQQVYRLVELAIFHAHRDPYFQLLQETAQKAAAAAAAGKKKKSKKKKSAQEPAEASKDLPAEDLIQEKHSEDGSAANSFEVQRPGDVSVEKVQEEEEQDDEEEGQAEEEEPEEEEIALIMEPVVRRPPSRSRQAPGIPGCLAWFPKVFADGSAEGWELMTTLRGTSLHDNQDSAIPDHSMPAGLRAFVKNTFVEVEEQDTIRCRYTPERKTRSAMF
eukprot:TRINITY_DN98619_c0_g1_i1.p1 TRINITY_DN98619_c0_g1~~TRINITY_DN98619_c0_g1_i1.p1  ORF type:complete len:399 (-),score=98.30 TRINITY_DN98619_c0_g1_i1:205-1317(-)